MLRAIEEFALWVDRNSAAVLG